MTKPERTTSDQRNATRRRLSSFGLRHFFVIRHSLFGFLGSFVIHPRGDAKRIEPPFHAHHSPNRQRHADTPVPRRQITAFSGFADGLPLASIRTYGELEAIASGRPHAQINRSEEHTSELQSL